MTTIDHTLTLEIDTMSTKARTLSKVVRLGTTNVYGDKFASVYCKIQHTEDGRLSISGVEGPTRGGNALGSCGQIVMHRPKIKAYAPGWNAAKVNRFYDVWDEWHLNDMRAGCEHQRAAGWGKGDKIEVVTYTLTREAWSERRKAEAEAARAGSVGEIANLTDTGRALLACDLSPHHAPDAGSPLSGCYEVKTREMKHAGHVYPSEHPAGILAKPCPECGYKHGSAWLREDVPPSVLDWLQNLPDTDKNPAWV